MAVRFDATAGKRMTRSSDLLDYNSPYTVSVWIYLISAPSGFTDFITFGANDTNTDLFQIRNTRVINIFCSTPNNRADGTLINIGQWYHIFIVRESISVMKMYLDGVLDATNNNDVSGRPASLNMTLGAAFFGGAYIQECDARLANLKIWSADKTANLSIEANTILPKDFTDLYGYYPIFPGSGERARDYSGNVRDWTEVGSLTDESHAPVSYGA